MSLRSVLPVSLFILLSLACVSAQSNVNFGRPDLAPATNLTDVTMEGLTQHVFKEAKSKGIEEIDERNMLRFAHSSSSGTLDFLQGPTLYRSWPEIEAYVNEVMQKVLPADYPNKKYIKAYVLKDGAINAFMTPSGQFFINIGLFTELKSEASLAGVIAHEVAHYTRSHGLNNFVKAITGEFTGSLFVKSSAFANAFSVENELDADETAKDYMIEAGYDLQGLIDIFETFKLNSDKALLREQYKWTLKTTTHPSSEARIKAIEGFLLEQTGEKHEYLVSQPKLMEFKDAAKAESLKYLLSANRFQTCLERAFRYHVLDPNNPTYIYYAMESIRRSCYLDVDRWSEQFMSEGYYDIVERDGKQTKTPIKEHFFEQFRPTILGMQPEDYEDIQAKFYWEEDVKFITNEQAYAFFYQIGQLFKEPECVLSNALSLHFDEAKMKEQLRAYLDYGDVRHKDYAEAMLNDRIYSDLPDKKLTTLNRFTYVVKQSADNIAMQSEGEDVKSRQLVEEVVSTEPDRKFIDLSRTTDLTTDDLLTITNLEEFSQQSIVSKGNKLEMYIFNPEYWDMLKRNGVNEMNFINCYYRTKTGGKYTKEDFEATINKAPSEFMSVENSKQHILVILLTGIRVEKDKNMKTRYFDGERRLSNKEDLAVQVKEFLEKDLASMWKQRQ